MCLLIETDYTDWNISFPPLVSLPFPTISVSHSFFLFLAFRQREEEKKSTSSLSFKDTVRRKGKRKEKEKERLISPERLKEVEVAWVAGGGGRETRTSCLSSLAAETCLAWLTLHENIYAYIHTFSYYSPHTRYRLRSLPALPTSDLFLSFFLSLPEVLACFYKKDGVTAAAAATQRSYWFFPHTFSHYTWVYYLYLYVRTHM